MLGFRLTMTQSFELATGNCFPEVEKWLNKDSDHWNAIQHVARRKNQDNYHDVLDFMFCEIFTTYRHSCFKFYEGEGEALIELISESDRKYYEWALLNAINHAYEIWNDDRRMSWKAFREVILSVAA